MKIKHIHIKALIMTLLLCIFVMPFSALADMDASYEVMYYTVSAGSLPANYSGNTTNLIDVRNPSENSVNTTTKSYAISAIAKKGVTVTVYAFNPNTNCYEKAYNENNQLMQTTVGASNLYAQTLTLKSGSNKFLLTAEKNGMIETAKFEVTLLNASFKDRLKSLTIGLIDMFG